MATGGIIREDAVFDQVVDIAAGVVIKRLAERFQRVLLPPPFSAPVIRPISEPAV